MCLYPKLIKNKRYCNTKKNGGIIPECPDERLITKNMWLEELEEERVPNPLFDKYKFELTPEELGIINTGYGNNQNQNGYRDWETDRKSVV